MKKWSVLLAALLALTGCSASEPIEDGSAAYRQIDVEEAIAMMETQQDYILLDVRTEQEFMQAHIPGAINIPNENISDEEIPELPNRNQLILVYCRSGNRSKQASEKLATMGYTNIVEFGGINAWPGDTVSGAV